MPLTDATVKAAKLQDKLYSLHDERGLSFEVAPNGTKRWRFRFQLNGKRNRLSLGVYPEVRLKDARVQRSSGHEFCSQYSNTCLAGYHS